MCDISQATQGLICPTLSDAQPLEENDSRRGLVIPSLESLALCLELPSTTSHPAFFFVYWAQPLTASVTIPECSLLD